MTTRKLPGGPLGYTREEWDRLARDERVASWDLLIACLTDAADRVSSSDPDAVAKLKSAHEAIKQAMAAAAREPDKTK